ncbi:MAG: ATP-dependent Clp protease adaptor ClpS [Bacteroidales bacterium]|nr:ATP-dependent Clp protease adaptor ClpS [Bacteroidales bacterium]
MSKKEKIQNKENETTDVLNSKNKFLILYNDDYHTFDYVIDALIDICKHQEEQAVQCTYLVHYKGKADVKKGSYGFLKPMMTQLRKRDLKAAIE